MDKDTLSANQKYVFEQFFAGLAHTTEGQSAMAVTNFKQVLKSDDIRPYFKEAAQWHLAVAYLKNGQAADAEKTYNQFVNCVDCEYTGDAINRWRMWWQIKWAQWLN